MCAGSTGAGWLTFVSRARRSATRCSRRHECLLPKTVVEPTANRQGDRSAIAGGADHGRHDRMSGFETFEVTNFLLQKGGVLPTARLAYTTRGSLNAARDNAVLVPSWYTGTHDDSETFMLGEQRALNPNKHFIILTN